MAKSPRLLTELSGLKGKILVCHCAADEECHADVLLEFLRCGDTVDKNAGAFSRFFDLCAKAGKRKVGEPVAWSPRKKLSSGRNAVSAGYQQRLGLVPPIFTEELEPGMAIKVALANAHPFDKCAPLNEDETQCLRRLESNRAAEFQVRAHSFWKGRAEELRLKSLQEIARMQDPLIRRLFLQIDDQDIFNKPVGTFVHLALYRELVQTFNVTDAKYIEEFARGLPIVGKVAVSGRWPPLEDAMEPEITLDELDERAWELQEKIRGRVERQGDAEIRRSLWRDTMEDKARGQCVGPFRTKAEVSRLVGTEGWIPTERFGLVQKDKTRGIDNAAKGAGSELNAATAATEKLQVTSTDTNVGLIRDMHSKLGHRMVEAWALDESAAYRQIPVAPEHRKYAVIALSDPETGRAAYFVMVGLSFGLVAAVLCGWWWWR